LEARRQSTREPGHGSPSFPSLAMGRIDRLAGNVSSHRLSMGIVAASTVRGRGAYQV
jgi:hypothetical protein